MRASLTGVHRVRDRNSSRCRIVLNRAVTSSVLGGLVRGLNCAPWFGLGRRDGVKDFLGMMFHASPLASAIVERSILNATWSQLRADVHALHRLSGDMTEAASEDAVQAVSHRSAGTMRTTGAIRFAFVMLLRLRAAYLACQFAPTDRPPCLAFRKTCSRR